MKIAVIGMGKIGLPLAVQYARKGHDVIGVDINSKTVDSINQGKEPFPEEAHLQEFLSEVIELQRLKATLSYEEAVSVADAIVVVVPLFVDENANPDFEAMDSATENIGRYLRKGSVVCYETTLPIGTTRTRFTPRLEKESGMEVGKDFSVVFSPERVFTGRIFADLRKYPKIVGGVTDSCGLKGMEFYESVLEFDYRPELKNPNGVWKVESADSAEFVKLAETTYRDVNIGLANQFAKYADKLNVNIYEVIESANSQPYSHIHQPGISVGGHCIPVYPQFYLWGDPSATIVKFSRECNSFMPKYMAEKVHEFLKHSQKKSILILGASYRDRVKEMAYSGIFPLKFELEQRGFEVEVFDSLFSPEELQSYGLQPMTSPTENFVSVIVQNSSVEFLEMFSDASKWLGLTAIFDGRNLFGGKSPLLNVPLLGLGIKDA